MGRPRIEIFFGIEVAYQIYLLLFQEKHMLELLEETDSLGWKPASIELDLDL